MKFSIGNDNVHTVEPGNSKPVNSKQPGNSKLFTVSQPVYSINHWVNGKLLPFSENGKTWQ